MNTEKPAGLARTIDYRGSRLEVFELPSGGRVALGEGERTAESPYLDSALAEVLGIPVGATFALIQRIFAEG